MIRTRKNGIKLKEYFITIIVTALVVFSLALCVELELLFRCEKEVNTVELNMANLVKFCTIEQLEKRIVSEPENYFVKIRLAEIFDSLGEYEKANKLFLDALKTSQRSNYSLYSYAIFCAKRNLFGISSSLAEELFGKSRKTLQFKAEIYEQIALSLIQKNEFEAATKAYQIAFKYAKNIKKPEYFEKIRADYAKSYVLLADENILQDNIKEAIFDLRNSLKIKETQEAQYKLGIILINIDKVSAEKYLASVFKKNPFMVNPYIYNKLLNDLIAESQTEQNLHSADYYTLKLNAFKKKLAENYIYKDDILIDNSHIVKTRKRFSKEEKYNLFFDIENNTKQKIEELFTEVELFAGDKQYKADKKFFSTANPLNFYEVLEQANIELPKDFELNDLKDKNEVIIKYFAKKSKKAPWTLLKIESLNI